MLIDLNKYEMNRKELIAFTAIIIVSAAAVSLLFYRNILFAAVVIPFIGKLKEYVTDVLIERRKSRFLVEFKDCLYCLSTSIGAGRSMKDAIAESIPRIMEIYGENAILVKELEVVFLRMEKGRETDVDVLSDLASSTGIEDVVDFVTVYSICKKSGASLIVALNKAANVIIDKMTIEREVKEIVKRKEAEGMLILIMPVAVILFLNLCSPDYISPLYDTLLGRVIMTFIIAANIGIYGIIQKIVKVEI